VELFFRDSLQMLAQRINCPAGLVLREIKCWPRRLDKVVEPLRFLVVAPECGSYLKFSAAGTDEFEEAIHRSHPIA
jgi:hypothetical protein